MLHRISMNVESDESQCQKTTAQSWLPERLKKCNVFGLIYHSLHFWILDISGNIPLRWNDTLKIAMALLHRHLHQMSIPAPGVGSSHPSQVLHPTTGHPNFRRIGIGNCFFFWRPHFLMTMDASFVKRNVSLTFGARVVFFSSYMNIYVCVCVSQFDDPKDEIQGKSLSSRGSEACSHVMNCWDVKRRSPEDVAAVHASTNVSTRDMYMFDIRWINTNPMTYAHK